VNLAYEEQSTGLGEDFLLDVRRAVDELLRAPDRWPRVEGGPVRRYLLVRFPYAIHSRPRRLALLDGLQGEPAATILPSSYQRRR
jgi:hypothetical protein